MKRTLPGIPTTYKGRRYRSRLEARYAAFFDALKWAHEYEPIDLHGYVPDFIIHAPGALGIAEPMVVEVKPFVPPFDGEDVAWCCQRIEQGGWLGDALVVGAQHRVDNEHDEPCLSLFDGNGELRVAPNARHTGTRVCIGRMRDGDGVWRDAYVVRDNTWQVTHDESIAALNSGDLMNVRIAWAEAGNVTQWKAPRINHVAIVANPPDPECTWSLADTSTQAGAGFDIASLFPTSRGVAGWTDDERAAAEDDFARKHKDRW